jgi:hypothetical protein
MISLSVILVDIDGILMIYFQMDKGCYVMFNPGVVYLKTLKSTNQTIQIT